MNLHEPPSLNTASNRCELNNPNDAQDWKKQNLSEQISRLINIGV